MLLHAGSFQYLSKVRLLWARQVWSNGWQKHPETCVCGSIIMNTLTSRNILAATLQMRMESLFSRKVGALSFVLLVAFLVWSCLVLSCPLLFSFLFYSPEFSFLLFSSCPFPSFPLSFSPLLSVSPVATQPLALVPFFSFLLFCFVSCWHYFASPFSSPSSSCHCSPPSPLCGPVIPFSFCTFEPKGPLDVYKNTSHIQYHASWQ